MKDAASRIANKMCETEYSGEPAWSRARIARDIRTAIRRAVKSERDRCVKCVICSEDSHLSQTNEQMCRAIIRKINTPAKRPSRKRK